MRQSFGTGPCLPGNCPRSDVIEAEIERRIGVPRATPSSPGRRATAARHQRLTSGSERWIWPAASCTLLYMPELPEVEALAVLKTYDPPLSALAGLPISGVGRHGKFLDISCGGDADGGNGAARPL